MWERLPATYQKLFQAADLARFEDGEMHSAVMNLALSYRVNYEMEFPPLNDVLITLHYARVLGLPGESREYLVASHFKTESLAVETVSVARRIPPILNLSYSFPLDIPRIRAIHHPEVLLASVFVLAAQYCFPFEQVAAPEQEGNFVQIPQMDWDKWREIMAPSLDFTNNAETVDFQTATAADITSMTPEELDKYFTHLSLQVDERGKSLASFFS